MRKNLKSGISGAALTCLVLAALPAGAERAPTLELVLKNGALTGDQDTFRFNEGDEIRIQWISDHAVELHLHGYNVTTRASPDAPGEMRFSGSVTGRFPVTSHGAGGEHHTLIYVEIHPR